MSVPVTLQYTQDGSGLTAEISCTGDPGQLKSGKRGWLAVSDELPWSFGWHLRLHCPVTETRQGYGYPRPAAGTKNYSFEEKYCGDLSVDSRTIRVRFGIPDCFDPPDKKSFTWGRPILIEEKMFHCALRLELRARDGGHLRRRGATPQCAGGVEFLSSGGDGDVVIGFRMDSEGGRGRHERIDAYCRQRLAEHFGGARYTDSKGYMTQRAKSLWFAALHEAGAWVDAHPSRTE